MRSIIIILLLFFSPKINLIHEYKTNCHVKNSSMNMDSILCRFRSNVKYMHKHAFIYFIFIRLEINRVKIFFIVTILLLKFLENQIQKLILFKSFL